MILETSFPPLMGQKGAKELKITSEEPSWMEHTCTSLLSQAENTLGFQLSSHRARSVPGRGERREPGVPGWKADAPGCGEGRTRCESCWGRCSASGAVAEPRKAAVPPPRGRPALEEMESKQTPERGRAHTCPVLLCQVQRARPSLSSPRPRAEAVGWDGDGWIIQIPSFPLLLRPAADHSSLRLQ